ncbi:MAG: LptE family protein [Candidatus Omnitrophica bacterium]|nr:LptE family protein [Candidatus Omnitrophota bacterium]
MKLFRVLILLTVAVSLYGCGYTFKSALPAGLTTIYVETFENKIDFTAENRRNLYLPLLEQDVRRAVTDRFLFDGNLKLNDENNADLILTGKLLNYRRVGLRFSSNDDVEEYRVYITVSLTLTRNGEEEPMWEESSFIGEATYFVSGSRATSEESAVREAVEDLARRIVERTVENW